MSKKLILYYSLEGSMKEMGEYLSKELNIPSEEIRPIKDVKKTGVNKYTIGGEQVMGKETPEIHALKSRIDEYDTIILGSPIWSASFAPAIRTVLENNLITGKKVAFYYGHEGNPGKCEERIRKEVEKNNELVSFYAISKPKARFEKKKEDFLAWAKEIE